MADKNEIDFTLNTDQGEQAAAHMNTTLDKTTAKAVQTAAAVQGVADSTATAIEQMERKLNVGITNTSDASKRRLVESTRRRVSGLESGGDPLKVELAIQEATNARLGKNTALLEQTNALHARAIELLQKREQLAHSKAEVASALELDRLIDDEVKKQQKLLDVKNAQVAADARLRSSIVSGIQRQGASPLEALGIDKTAKLAQLTSLGASAAELKMAEEGFKKLENQALASSKNIGARIAEFITSPTYAARKSLGDFLQEFGKLGIIAGGVLIGLGVLAKEMFDLVRSSGKAAEEVVNLGERLNITASQAAVLQGQAKIAGVDVGAFSGLIRKLSTDLTDGGTEARQIVRALEAIGVTVGAAGDKFRNPIDILRAFSVQLNKIPDHAAQIDLLSRAFGRGAIELLPLIKNFAELERKSEETGIALNEDLYKRLAAVDDKLDQIGISWDALRLKMSEKIVATIEIFSGKPNTAFAASLALTVAERIKKQTATDAAALIASVEHSGFLEPSQIKALLAAVDEKRQKEDAKFFSAAPSLFNTAGITVGTAANQLVDRFNKGQDSGLQGLQRRLADLTKDQERIGATIVKSGPADKIPPAEMQARIDNFNRLGQAIKTVTEQIKDYNAEDSRLKASKDFALTGTTALSEAQEKLYVSLHLGDQPLIAKYYEENAKAAGEYAKAIEAAKNSTGQVSAANQKLLSAGLQSRQSAAFTNLSADFQKGMADLIPAAAEMGDRIAEEQKKKQEELNKENRALENANTLAITNYRTTQFAQQRDAEIRAIEQMDAKTLQQKVGFELAKGQIEAQFVQNRLKVQEDANQLLLAAQIDEQNVLASTGERTRQQADAHIALLKKAAGQKDKQDQLDSIAEIGKAREEATIRATQAIVEANTKVFDTFKRESEGIFDAMLTRSQNVFQAIGNALKNVLLTAVKDIVSTQSARLLTELFTGQKVGLTPGTIGTGPLSKIGQVLGIGSKPTFPGVKIPTVHSTLGDAIPVVVANPEAIQQKVDIKSTAASSQVNQQLSFGGGGAAFASGAGRVPLTAMLAVAMGLGQQAAAQALPPGYTPVSQQTSSSIQYAGGGVQDLGGAIRRFGSDTNGYNGQGNELGVGSLNSLISGGGFSLGSAQIGAGVSGGGAGTDFGIPGIAGIGQSVGGLGGGLGNIKGMLGNLKGLVFNKTASSALGGGLGGGIAGALGSPLSGAIGLGLLTSANKNPYGVGGGVKSGVGGALTGFSLGSQFTGAVGPFAGLYGAEIGAGIGLFMNGFQRGGAAGFGESIAGGALAGFGVAGPIGAAVGAGVGALVGGLRWAGVISTKTEKIHDQIKSIYGIDIRDNKVLSQLKQMIDQQFGGNVEVGVRSLPIRQFVELYAQSTGQNSRGIVDRAQASVFANQGGRLTQMPTYFNGAAVLPGQTSSTIGIPTISPGGGYSLSPVVGGANAAHTTILSLDGPTTAAVLQGQAKAVITNSPRLISDSTSAGMSASAARRDIAAGVLSPSFMTS